MYIFRLAQNKYKYSYASTIKFTIGVLLSLPQVYLRVHTLPTLLLPVGNHMQMQLNCPVLDR